VCRLAAVRGRWLPQMLPASATLFCLACAVVGVGSAAAPKVAKRHCLPVCRDCRLDLSIGWMKSHCDKLVAAGGGIGAGGKVCGTGCSWGIGLPKKHAVNARLRGLSCPLGKYVMMDFCNFCYYGHYGTWLSVHGHRGDGRAVKMARCTLCPAGKYQDGVGQTACFDCPAGTISIAARDSCEALNRVGCAAGHRSAHNGTACVPCESGRYQPYTGRSTCVACPPGQFAAAATATAAAANHSRAVVNGTTSCAVCEAGTFQRLPGQGICHDCGAGTVQPANASRSCVPCYEGGEPAPDRRSCSPCAPGKFRVDAMGPRCIRCPRGRYQPKRRGRSCAKCPKMWPYTGLDATGCTQKLQCRVGRFEWHNRMCVGCPAGKFGHLTNRKACLECAGGMAQPKRGQGSCVACRKRVGALVPAGSTSCTARAQSHTSRCPAGRYESVSSTCAVCTPGHFSTYGQAACTACKPGTIAQHGAGFCSTCPPGRVAPHRAFACTMCAPGRYSRTQESSCRGCEQGFGSNAASARCTKLVTACKAGAYPSSRFQCAACAPGQIQRNATALHNCTKCTQGKFQPKSGKISCDMCPAGRAQGFAGRQLCTACVPGMYQRVEGQATCDWCAPGQYASTLSAAACLPCPAGKFCQRAGCLRCETCSRGQVSSGGGWTCRVCSRGTGPGPAGPGGGCLPCAAGRFGTRTGECLLCPAGKFDDQKQESECTACRAGRFAAAPGATLCGQCPAQYVQPARGQQNCVPCEICPLGRLRVGCGGAALGVCNVCSPGRYARERSVLELMGRTVPRPQRCTSCPAGKYRGPGDHKATRCFECLDGMSSTRGAATCSFSAMPPVFGRNTSLAEEETDVDRWEDASAKRNAQKASLTRAVPGTRDCALSQWSKFFGCDASGSQRFRERRVLRPAENGGKDCSTFLFQVRVCPNAKVSEKQAVMQQLEAQFAAFASLPSASKSGADHAAPGVAQKKAARKPAAAPTPAVLGIQVTSAYYRQGIAPFFIHPIVASLAACKHLCMGRAECHYGTYFSAGQHQGECWLSKMGCEKCLTPCGFPCVSFRKLFRKSAGSAVIKTKFRLKHSTSVDKRSFGFAQHHHVQVNGGT
jgi:hypothetical protein